MIGQCNGLVSSRICRITMVSVSLTRVARYRFAIAFTRHAAHTTNAKKCVTLTTRKTAAGISSVLAMDKAVLSAGAAFATIATFAWGIYVYAKGRFRSNVTGKISPDYTQIRLTLKNPSNQLALLSSVTVGSRSAFQPFRRIADEGLEFDRFPEGCFKSHQIHPNSTFILQVHKRDKSRFVERTCVRIELGGGPAEYIVLQKAKGGFEESDASYVP